MYQYSNNFPIDIFFANNTTSSFKIFERPIGLTRIWSFSHLFFPIPELSLHVQLFTPVSFDQLSNPLLLQPWNVDYLYARDPLLLPFPPTLLPIQMKFFLSRNPVTSGTPPACSVALGLSSCYGLSHYNSGHARSRRPYVLQRDGRV